MSRPCVTCVHCRTVEKQFRDVLGISLECSEYIGLFRLLDDSPLSFENQFGFADQFPFRDPMCVSWTNQKAPTNER